MERGEYPFSGLIHDSGRPPLGIHIEVSAILAEHGLTTEIRRPTFFAARAIVKSRRLKGWRLRDLKVPELSTSCVRRMDDGDTLVLGQRMRHGRSETVVQHTELGERHLEDFDLEVTYVIDAAGEVKYFENKYWNEPDRRRSEVIVADRPLTNRQAHLEWIHGLIARSYPAGQGEVESG